MCGIFCVISSDQTKNITLKGLKALEYRGYDSAGMAFINSNDKISAIKAIGKVRNLELQCQKSSLEGNIVISHTRWATHGAVTIENTHPIHNDQTALVHNGIIENFEDIKDNLENKGYQFRGQTDTEVALNLLQYYLDQDADMLTAISKLTAVINGNFSICILNSQHPDKIFCTKKGSPLVIAAQEKMKFIASDVNTLSLFADHYIMLEDDDIAVVDRRKAITIWQNKQEVKRNLKKINKVMQHSELSNFSSFMEQEINEQPKVLQNLVQNIIQGYWQKNVEKIEWSQFKHVTIIACGSSYNAGMIAKYWFESIAKISVEVEFSSEFRARDIIFNQDTLYLFISQSGETLDTLVALKKALKNNVKTLSLINTIESTIAHLSDYILPLGAGVEKSVAATKSFTAQLFHLLNIAFYVGCKKNSMDEKQYQSKLQDLAHCNNQLTQLLQANDRLKSIANEIIRAKNIIFIGRQELYPLALEGALKLKELSYLPVHAYAAGELKHGPISLIDNNSVVIALATDNATLPKVLANLEEVKTRGARTIIITDTKIKAAKNFDHIYALPFQIGADTHYQAIAFSLPLQLISFYVAAKMGLNVDRPRNLAKSVTVE